jgi:diguanylate cyclase (GGDEF)-like protein
MRGRAVEVAGNRPEYWPEGNPRGAPRKPALQRLYRELREHSPVSADDLAEETHHSLRDIGWESGSLLSALVVGDEGHDAMIICHDLRRDYFGRGDAQTLVIFADQVAVALRNAQQFEEQRRLATVDSLTSLANRRTFHEQAELLLRENRRPGRCAVIMMDVDHFKSVNDRFGHSQGDLVLKAVASAAQSVLRPQDLIARWGGEEFAVLLTGLDERTARRIAERMRAAVEQSVRRPDSAPVTVSLGVSLCEEEPELEQMLQVADRSLYQAKALGRNTVCVDSCLDRDFLESYRATEDSEDN